MDSSTVSPPRIWVIIPSFNNLVITRSCLLDLSRQTYRNIGAVVSDSGSEDGTCQMIQKDFPLVTVVCGNPAWWWTKATNEGIKYVLHQAAAHDYIMTLNNDVLIPNHYIAEMVNFAEQHRESIVGSVIYDAAEPNRLVECGGYIDWRTMKYHSLSLTDFDDRGYCEKLTFLCGKGVLYPVDVFRRYGLFDEAVLPHYGADQDFVASCKNRGYSIRVQTNVRLYSREEISAVGARDIKGLLEKLKLLFVRKSKLNLVVHMRLMLRHSPVRYWATGLFLLICRLVGHIFIKKGVQHGPAQTLSSSRTCIESSNGSSEM